MNNNIFRYRLAGYLQKHHCGEENAIHSRDLESLLGIDRRTLQRNISRLRQEAIPICSSEAGYFFARTEADIKDTLQRLNNSATSITNARDGMLRASMLYQKPMRVTIYIQI